MIGTSRCQKFPFRISAFADPKNIPMSQEVQRKRKEPTKRRTKERFPIVVPKSDSGRAPNESSRVELSYKQIESSQIQSS